MTEEIDKASARLDRWEQFMATSSVLFVCLGNICRSPMADGILRKRLADRGITDIEVDSCGTAHWHIGKLADPRTREVLRRHGAPDNLVSRQIDPSDFEKFDVILVMDKKNLANCMAMCPPEHQHKVHLCLEPTTGGEVPDPYWGGEDGFETVYGLLDTALDAWMQRWGVA